MSTFKVDTINNDGTNATDATNGFTIAGNSIVQGYTSSASEPSSPSAGDLWWDSTNEVLKRYINSEWKELSFAQTSGSWYGDRGVIGGGANNSGSRETAMQYIAIATTGNAASFGNLTTGRFRLASVSDGTYGLWAGGLASTGDVNTIDYVTVATIANASDFGDLTAAYKDHAGCSDGTYGLFGGPSVAPKNVIEYVTIATTGNGADFGDLTVERTGAGAAADATYGVWVCGQGSSYENTMDYVTIQTPANATDFGDATVSAKYRSGTSDTTYGVFAGGILAGSPSSIYNVIDYITISTPANATDFGDLTNQIYAYGSGATDATYGVFAGGYTGTTRTNVIQYITIASPSNATDFGDLSQALNGTSAVGASSS